MREAQGAVEVQRRHLTLPRAGLGRKWLRVDDWWRAYLSGGWNKNGRRAGVERRASVSEHSLWSQTDHQSLPLSLGFLV